jgi:hypothetical protein
MSYDNIPVHMNFLCCNDTSFSDGLVEMSDFTCILTNDRLSCSYVTNMTMFQEPRRINDGMNLKNRRQLHIYQYPIHLTSFNIYQSLPAVCKLFSKECIVASQNGYICRHLDVIYNSSESN